VSETTVKLNAEAEAELNLFAGPRPSFEYHRHLGRILSQRAWIAALADIETASWLLDRAAEEHQKALQKNSGSRIDRLFQEQVFREQARLRS
jgi:hypothetical protein